MNAISTIRYTPELSKRIRNTDSLPVGKGCKFLVCIRGEGTDLIAKRWCRKMPKKLWSWETVVAF